MRLTSSHIQTTLSTIRTIHEWQFVVTTMITQSLKHHHILRTLLLSPSLVVVVLVDGSKVKQPNCPFPGLELDGTASFPNQGKSMVASAFTIVSLVVQVIRLSKMDTPVGFGLRYLLRRWCPSRYWWLLLYHQLRYKLWYICSSFYWI